MILGFSHFYLGKASKRGFKLVGLLEPVIVFARNFFCSYREAIFDLLFGSLVSYLEFDRTLAAEFPFVA